MSKAPKYKLSDEDEDQKQEDDSEDSEEERMLRMKLQKIKEKKKAKKEQERRAAKEAINQKLMDPQLEELKRREKKLKLKEAKGPLTKDRRVRMDDEESEESSEDDGGRFYNHRKSNNKVEDEIDVEYEPKTTKEILSRDDIDPESTRTIWLYFGNLLSFVFVMLIYYGLVILFAISAAIHFYDYVYNYEEFKINFGLHDPGLEFSEFKSSQQIRQMEKGFEDFHKGHSHWHLPFDLGNIQISVWLAVLPVTLFVWKNLQMLKMETFEEYIYLKKQNGIQTLFLMRLLAYMITVLYIGVILANLDVFRQNGRTIW